ncbi:MAG: replicative DNA helicase, partial [Pseudoflavonifractor sp.]
MPHSVEAEQAVLGSMLIDARCVPDVVELLKIEDFYLRQNREIYETIYSMFNFSLTIDPVTVLDQMRQAGVYNENTSRNYLLQLMEITPTAANVKEYAAIVKDKSLLRRIAETAGEITALIGEGTGTGQEVLEAAEQRIFAIRQGRSAQGLEHISTVILSVYERLNELAARGAEVPGLSTGLGDLDRAISGLNDSDLILLAARPGMGKTSMALNILLHAGKESGKAVVFFSLEMSREQLAMRLISGESYVDNKKLVTGNLSEKDWSDIAAASASLNKTNILIDDNPSLSVADMNAKCRRVDNLGLVVIDYLQLMTSAGGSSRGGDNRQQVVSDISRSLKIMAKELKVPVLCLSQLSRANESRSDKRPMLSDLRESGAIEQDADIVMFLYREDYYEKETENRNLAECII